MRTLVFLALTSAAWAQGPPVTPARDPIAIQLPDLDKLNASLAAERAAQRAKTPPVRAVSRAVPTAASDSRDSAHATQSAAAATQTAAVAPITASRPMSIVAPPAAAAPANLSLLVWAALGGALAGVLFFAAGVAMGRAPASPPALPSRATASDTATAPATAPRATRSSSMTSLIPKRRTTRAH